MEIIVGSNSGFCLGVNYTYNRAKEEIEKEKVYCLGEIIHNKQVVDELENMGMITVLSINDIPKNSRVIFRAHGEALQNNIEIIDLTCGKVKIIHNKVLKEKDDSFIIIIGKKSHPEIIGTKGFCTENCYVIENISDVEKSYKKFIESKLNKVYVISQTTFSSSLFDELVSSIKKTFKNNEIKIDKTICKATEKRQEETLKLSKKCTKILVIGSKNSSNTKELYNIAKNNCNSVYFIENEEDVLMIQFEKDDIVGVVAGASAPKSLIDRITFILEEKYK